MVCSSKIWIPLILSIPLVGFGKSEIAALVSAKICFDWLALNLEDVAVVNCCNGVKADITLPVAVQMERIVHS